MKVLILGAGLAGLTSAWYLRQQGFEVAVFDWAANQAQASKLACASSGLTSAELVSAEGASKPCYSQLAAQLDEHWQQWRWSWLALSHASARRAALNHERLLRLALHSRGCWSELYQAAGLDQAQVLGPSMRLLRSAQQFDAAYSYMQQLTQQGVVSQLLQPEEVVEVEPALQGLEKQLLGALYLPADQQGEGELFKSKLLQLCLVRGVIFHWVDSIAGWHSEADQVHGVLINGQLERADHYVMALDFAARPLLSLLGIELPLSARQFFSFGCAGPALQTRLVDAKHKLQLSSVEGRLQIAGLAGFAVGQQQSRVCEKMAQAASRLLGIAREPQPADIKCELSYLMPDAMPVLGPSSYANLWLNLGHSKMAWQLSSGAGQHLACLIAGNQVDLSLAGLSMFRF